MAGQKRNNYHRTAATINSKWLTNTLKSMGVAGTEVIKDLMPATSETISSGSRLAGDVARDIKTNISGNKKVTSALSSNPVIKMGQDFFKNAVEDIKSGNIYNTERVGDEDPLSDLDTLFDDIDSYFGDDENANVDVNIQQNVVDNSQSTAATIAAIKQQSEYQVKASKATVDTMLHVGSTTLVKMNEIGSKMLSELSSINSNLAALVDYNNTNMTKFIEASIGYYEQMSTSMESSSSGSSRVTADNIYGSGGGLDLNSYKDYVRDNIKALKNDSMIGSMASMIIDNKDAFITNPLGGILKTVMQSAIPKVMQTSMQALDESVKDFIPVILDRISTLGEGETGEFVSINKTIAKVLGVKTTRRTEFDTSKIQKGPIPYNGVANHTIIEIIPKYLRESNTYLKEIAKAVTGKNESDFKSGFMGYDWDTGKFRSMEDIEAGFYDQLADTVVSKFQLSKGGEALSSYRGILSSEKDQEKFDEVLRHVFINMEKHNGEIDFSSENDIKSILDGIDMPSIVRTAYEEAFKDMQSNNQAAIGNLNATRMRAVRDRNQQMKFFEENAAENGLFGIDHTGSTYDSYTAKQAASVSTSGMSTKSVNMSVPSILTGIQNTLNRGIYVQYKNWDRGSSSSSTEGTTSNIPTPEVDTSTQTREELLEAIRERNETEVILNDYDTTSGSIRQRAGNVGAKGVMKFKGILDGIMAGDADAAWDSFMAGMKGTFEKAGSFLSEHFFTPIKKHLFGEKNEDGYIEGGLFGGVNNRMKESFYSLRRMVTGKGYIDAEGNRVVDANEEEMKNTVAGKLKGMVKTVGDSIKTRLFGEDTEDEEGNKKEGVIGTFKSKLSSATGSFMKGLSGWKKALFGEKTEEGEDEEKTGKEVFEDLKKRASDVMPTAITGGLSGGILGMLVGGPVGGALLGFAGGIASKSEKFQNWVFGEKDEEGNRTGGLISKNVQDYVKKNGKFLLGGAALGAIKGGISGAGVLGNLIGGPVAGAILGLGSSMIIKSDAFQKFLFGDEEAGQLGVVNHIKRWTSGFGKNIEGSADGGKLAGMMAIGAGTGGVLGMLVGGPVAGAVLGLGASILAQKDNFHEWLFGYKDEKTGEKREGILGQFKNMLTVNVFRPLGNNLKEIGADFKDFLRYDILGKFNLIIEPIGDAVFGGLRNIVSKSSMMIKDFGSYIKDNFLTGLIEKSRAVLAPLTTAVGNITKGAYTIGKKIIGAPMDLLYAITSPIARGVGNVVKTVASTAFKGVDMLLIKPIQNIVLKPLGKVVKGVGKVVAAPFKLLANVAEKFNDHIIGGIEHVTRFISMGIDEIKKDIANSAPVRWVKERFKDAKDFGARVKNTISRFVSPVTNLAKSAITTVTTTIKESVSNFFGKLFHAMNPLTWVKGAFKLGKKAIRFLQGKDPNEPDEKEKKPEGRLRRLWRESGEGIQRDRSSDMITDENGRVIGTNLSYTQRRKNLEQDRRDAKIRREKEAKENKNHSYNERLIAKYTGNQRKDDTNENRLLAENEARRRGATINWKGDAFQTKTEEYQDESLETQKDIREHVKDLADFLMGRKRTGKVEQDNAHIYGEAKEKAEAKMDRDQRIFDEARNARTWHERKDSKRTMENLKEVHKYEDKQERENVYDNFFSGATGKDKTTIERLHGLKSGFSKSFAHIRGEWAGMKDSLNKHAKGTDSAEAGLAIVGEEGPEAVYSKNAKFGKLVGLNGPEVIKMKGGETVIPNTRLPKYAEGTGKDEDFNRSKESDKNLVDATDSTKLTIGERVIRELIHIKNGMLNFIRLPFLGLHKDYDVDNKDEEVEDNASISEPEPPKTTALSTVVDSTIGAIGGIMSSNIAEQEGAENAARINKAKAAQDSVSSLTGERRRELAEALREEESDDAREDAKLAALEKLVGGQSHHNTVWDSIFSKKGLITAALIAAIPLLLKFLKPDSGTMLGGWLQNAFGNFSFGNENLGDGKTSLEKLQDEVNQGKEVLSDLMNGDLIGAAKDFIFDEDGNVTHQSGARAKGVVKLGAKGIAGLTGLGVKGGLLASSVANGFRENGIKGAIGGLFDEGTNKVLGTKSTKVGSKTLTHMGMDAVKENWGKLTGKTPSVAATISDDVAQNTLSNLPALPSVADNMLALPGSVGDVSFDAMGKVTSSAVDDISKSTVQNNLDTVASSVGKTLKGSVDDVVEASTKETSESVIKYFKNFIDDLFKSISKKSGKIAASSADNIVKSVVGVLKKPKMFEKILSKVSDVLGLTAGLAVIGVGLLAKEVTWVVLGAVSGATGAKRLFRTDKVDALMVTISTAMGAFNGTTVGSICDIVNELIVSVLGFDVYTELATLIYGLLAGQEKAEKLYGNQEKFENQYIADTDAEISKQYETMKKAGLIGEDVTEEQFNEGARNGDYGAEIQSFADYNDEKHQTLGSTIWNGLSSAGSWIGDKASKAWGSIAGSTDKYYEDSNGNQYRKNKDGTYQVTSADGEDLGYIGKGALPEDAKEVKEKKDGLVQKAGKGLKSAGNWISDKASKAWSGIKSGASKVKDGAASLLESGKEKLSSGWNKIKEGASSLWGKTTKKAGETFDKLKEAPEKLKKGLKDFITKDTVQGYLSDDGSYYTGDGKHYSATGALLGDIITAEELANMVASGLLEPTEITTRESGVGKIVNKAKDTLKAGWNKVSEGASNLWNGLKDNASNLWNKTKEKASEIKTNTKNFFVSHNEKAWYDTEGGYYRTNGSGFDYYSANGDKISENLPADDIQAMITSGQLTEGEIKVESGLKSGLKDIGSKVSSAWTSFKEGASNLWNGVKEKVNETWNKVSSKVNEAKTSVKNFFVSHNEKAWYDTEGGYYKSNGSGFDYYNANGDKLNSITADAFDTMVTSGKLTEGEVKVDSGLKSGLKDIGSKISGAWTSFKEGASNLWNGAKEKVSATFATVKEKVTTAGTNVRNFLLPHTEKRWHSTEGGYYQSNGSTYDYYNDNGDKIQEGITAEDFNELVLKGIVTADDAEEVTVNSTVATKFKEVTGIVKETFKGATDAAVTLWTDLKSTAGSVVTSIKEKGIANFVGGLFKTKKDVGYFLADGTGYYKLESNGKYAKYNMNGDLLEENIESSKIQDLIESNLVTEGEIEVDSEAKKAIKDIKSSVKEAWSTAKDTVKNGWDKFKSWITGGSGVGTTVSNSAKGNPDWFGGNGFGISSKNFIRGGRGTEPETLNGSTYYSQNDPRWANQKYVQSNGTDDGATMANSGCGPTAMSMVISDMNRKNVSPTELARFAQFSGSRDETGTNWSFIDNAASAYGIDSIMSQNPSAEFVKQSLRNGNPMILSGQDDGSGNSPYTKAGHYVVAVGLDSSGNVIYNDPRGKSYSGRKNVNDIMSNTGAAWSFSNGGFGKALKRAGNSIKRFFTGGRGAEDVEKWVAIVQAVKQAIAAQKPGYSQSRWITIKVGGRSLSVRTDCSGLVAACAKYFGAISNSTNLYTANMLNTNCPLYSSGCFKKLSWSGWDNLNCGDIIVYNGHTEIFAKNEGGRHYVWNCGSDSSVNNPGLTTDTRNYTVVWRPIKAGSNCLTDLTVDTSGLSIIGDSSSSSDDGFITTTTRKSIFEDSDIFTNLATGYSKIAENAWGAVMTGNLNRDWDNVWYETTTTTSSSSSTNNGDSSYSSGSVDLSGNTQLEQIWNFLISRGYTKEAAAGIMGCWQPESDNRSNRIEGDYLSGFPGYDTLFNSRSAMNSWTTDRLFPTYAKSGISINKKAYKGSDGNYYPGLGLAQWTGPRGYNLLQHSNVTGKNWGSLENQLSYFDKEMSSRTSLKNNINSQKSAYGAAAEFFDGFEMCEGYGASHPSALANRTDAAKSIYSKFAGGGAGEGPTISKRKYVGSRETVNGGFGEEVELVKTSLNTKSVSGTTGQSINNLTNNNLVIDNSSLEGLMTEVVRLLTTITKHSGNLDLLKDIRTGIGNVGTTLVTNTTNNVSNNNGNKTSMNRSATGNYSSEEITARKIAFGA